jgi:cysteinyl-tRNA synthetase
MLEDWVEAKRNKDYTVADKIRADLKDRGIRAEDHRPPPGGPRR